MRSKGASVRSNSYGDGAMSETGAAQRPRKLRFVLRAAAVVVVVAALLLFGRQAAGYLPAFTAWVDGLGVWGRIVFVAGYTVATVAFIPGSLLTLAGGAVFGLVEGTALVFVAASLGATAAFLASRHLVRGAIEKRVAANPRFAAIDGAVGRQGFRIVLLLRLTPVVPFVLLNYALGLTKVRLRDYVSACVGMLPATLLYVYYGVVIGDVAQIAAGVGEERSGVSDVLLGVGLIATIVVTTILVRIAARAYREAVGE